MWRWVVNAMPRMLYSRDPVAMYRKLGGPQGQSGRMRKILPPPGFHPRTVQPVVSLYTDWAIQAISLFMAAYLTTVYSTQIMQHRTFENSYYRNDAEGIGGDADIYAGGLRRTKKNLKKDSLCHGRIRTRYHQHISLQQASLLE